MSLTDEQYEALDSRTKYRADGDACVVAYNGKHGTAFKYQHEMVKVLYEDGMSSAQIAAFMPRGTTKNTMLYRLRNMGVKIESKGGYGGGRGQLRVDFGGGRPTLRQLAKWYDINYNTVRSRYISRETCTLHEALTKPLKAKGLRPYEIRRRKFELGNI